MEGKNNNEKSANKSIQNDKITKQKNPPKNEKDSPSVIRLGNFMDINRRSSQEDEFK